MEHKFTPTILDKLKAAFGDAAHMTISRVGTKRVQAILESTYSGLGRDSDMAWLDELGTHMERFSLCGFGITAPSILRTTMREFPEDYRVHIQERRCPEGTCKAVRSRRYETMVQP